ncbi:MAG: Arm DNA-binding domain-containing protein, partial [Burkholderiaceae bacterium]
MECWMADGRRNPTKKPLTEHNLLTRRAGLHSDTGREGVPGLMLRVTEGGARYWVYRYAFEGKRRDMGIGSMVDIPALESAREEA